MTNKCLSAGSVFAGVTLTLLLFAAWASGQSPPGLQPLPPLKASPAEQVELGKLLFFDKHLSGNGDRRCADCHDPTKGWTDGLPLSDGYPGTKYFRNTKTVLNVAYAKVLYWDGRLDATDLPTQARDAITESHFQNMDGRLMLERLKQKPEYVERFKTALGGEPSFGRTLTALAVFQQSLVSRNVPLDRYLLGEAAALSDEAKQGLALFQGKAGCIQCHHGPYLSDGKPHNLGVPENPDVFTDTKRHITYRSVMKFLGVPNYMNLRRDVGYYAVSKLPQDISKFITPSLREVSRTAPYMHNGILPTLETVVEFYDAGGGADPNKSPLLKPLGLSPAEKAALMELLKSLSGDEILPPDLDRLADPKKLPQFQVMQDWWKAKN